MASRPGAKPSADGQRRRPRSAVDERIEHEVEELAFHLEANFRAPVAASPVSWVSTYKLRPRGGRRSVTCLQCDVGVDRSIDRVAHPGDVEGRRVNGNPGFSIRGLAVVAQVRMAGVIEQLYFALHADHVGLKVPSTPPVAVNECKLALHDVPLSPTT
jgi:hypothetical protein